MGLTRAAVNRLRDRGWLHPVHVGVYAVGHTALTLDARSLAATFALGDAATLSHRSAAELWEILQAGPGIHVTVPTYAGHPHRDGIRVHRQRLRPDERTTLRGIPCTTLARSLTDIAASAPRLLHRAFEEAQVRHGLRPAVLAAEVAVRRGHRGTARLRAVLRGAVDPGAVESILELRFLALCATHGLPRPQTQVRIAGWRVDFWFPQARVAVETDGARYHASAAKRARDARKTAELEALRIRVVRIRWADVADAAGATAEVIGVAIAR